MVDDEEPVYAQADVYWNAWAARFGRPIPRAPPWICCMEQLDQIDLVIADVVMPKMNGGNGASNAQSINRS